MAQTATQTYATGVVHHQSGSYTGTHTAVDFTITLGFVPKYFKIMNVTDRITHEWWNGMNTGDFIETVAAGDRTLEIDDKLVVNTDGTVDVVVDGGIYTDNDTVVWEAWA